MLPRTSLLLAFPVVSVRGTERLSRSAETPLVGIRIVEKIHGRVVGDQQINQVGATRIGELVHLAGRVQHGIAGCDRRGAGDRAFGAGALEDEEEFPLRRVAVQRVTAFARAEFHQLKIEGMAAEPGGREAFCAEGDREFLAGAAEFSLGRSLRVPRQVVEVTLARAEGLERWWRGRTGGLVERCTRHWRLLAVVVANLGLAEIIAGRS